MNPVSPEVLNAVAEETRLMGGVLVLLVLAFLPLLIGEFLSLRRRGRQLKAEMRQLKDKGLL